MNTNSNIYTFAYASLLVVVVAAGLAFVSGALHKRQQSNMETEKRLNILLSARIGEEAAAASDKNALVAHLFDHYITDSYLVNSQGKRIAGDAFYVDMKNQYELIKQGVFDKLQLPVFECTLQDSSRIYVVGVYGLGLWGPIWGYLSFKDDFNTIYGAVFDHKGETPGLGAEIATKTYAKQFQGKTIFGEGTFVSIKVVKGGAKASDAHAVDAISGGTMTSNALEHVLHSCLSQYLPFFTLNMP